MKDSPTLITHFPRPASIPHGKVSAVAALPDGRLLVAHMHKVAQLTWFSVYDDVGDAASGRVLTTPQRGVVNMILPLSDGRIVTASRPQGDDPGVVCFLNSDLERVDLWPVRMRAFDRERAEAIVQRRKSELAVVHLPTGETRHVLSLEGLRPRFHDPFGAAPAFWGRKALFVPEGRLVVATRLSPGAERVEMRVDFDVARVLCLGPERSALVGFDGRLEVWETWARRRSLDLSVAGRAVVSDSVQALPGAAAVFAAWEDGGCAVWSLPEGERLQSFCAPPDLHPEDSVRGPLNRALFDPEGHHFLATHMDQHLHLGDLTEGQWRGHWEAQAPITAFARAPFGLLVGDMDGHVSATTCRLL